MKPFFFGSSQQQLFGITFFPDPEKDCGKGIVICQPLWQEYIRAHWATNQLAHSLANNGFHVMVFDYYSTGDSAGESGIATADQMSADISSAIEELCESTGNTEFGLIGIRFGATLAAHCISNNNLHPFATAFWDPVATGKEYLEQLETLNQSRGPAYGNKNTQSFSGFPVTREQIHSIETINETTWFSDHAVPYLTLFSDKELQIMWEQLYGKPGGCTVMPLPKSDGDWFNVATYDKILMTREVQQKMLEYFLKRYE